MHDMRRAATRCALMIGLSLLSLAPFVGPSAAAPVVRAEHIRLELVAQSTAVPGAQVRVALHQMIEPGWHTYWRNPGDSGQPTEVVWSLPTGWSASSIEWPLPERARTGSQLSFVYSGDVLLPMSIQAPATATVGRKVTAAAHVSLLVCKDVCIPQDVDLKVDLPVTDVAIADAVWGHRLERAMRVASDIPATRATYQSSGENIELDIAGTGSRDVAGTFFFPFKQGVLDASSAEIVSNEPGRLTVKFRKDRQFQSVVGAQPLEGVLKLGRDGAVQISALPQPARGANVPSKVSKPVDGNAYLVAAGAMGLAFIGGVILNLMPCVFPILSMKAVALSRHGGSPKAAQHEALAYLAGVLATFLGLAAVLVVLRRTGEVVGWGFQLQSPVVVGLLTLVMLASALNLSGMFEFGASAQGIGAGLTAKSGPAGAFFTGVLAVVVAAPCTGPFMATSIGWALAQPDIVALMIFAALGLGLAAPFVLLAFVPALHSRMPRPGPWMDIFRKALAFPMFGSTAWLAWVFASEVGLDGLPRLYLSALALAFGLWVFGWRQKSEQIARGSPIASAAAIGSIVAAVGLVASVPSEAGTSGPATLVSAAAASAWSPARVRALQANGKVVLVDFTAAWCVTCKLNEGGALADPAVRATMQEMGAAYLRADWTNRNPEISEALRVQGRAGVPLYLVYGKHGGAPEVLPQLLTADAVLGALKRAGGA